MMNKTILTILVCLAGQLMLASTGAADSAASPAAQLAQQFTAMENVRGQFQQQIVDEQGNVLQEASGELAVKRPRHFYWKTTSPYEHLLVAKGDTLWLYDIDLEQITRKPFSEKLDQAPALILSGEVDALAEQYQIDLDKDASSEQLIFSLSPKQEGGVFSQLLLRFKAEKLQSMTLVDSFQQRTLINFSDLVYNSDIPDALFEFSPPDGVDIITDE